MGNVGTKSKTSKIKLEDNQPRAVDLIPQKREGLPFITFSFRYCSQQEFFGTAGQDAQWFASLQDRLKDLSNKTGAIIENKIEREHYRLHPINWDAYNCPITANDLLSVPKNIIDNAEPDFFWQFQLSKGTGRVVGFFNEDVSIFYIVLLDPKHNIQPSKDYGYRVDDTEIALTEYEQISIKLADCEKLLDQCQHIQSCPISKRIRTEYVNTRLFYVCLDNELKDVYAELINSGKFQTRMENILIKEYIDKQEG